MIHLLCVEDDPIVWTWLTTRLAQELLPAVRQVAAGGCWFRDAESEPVH